MTARRGYLIRLSAARHTVLDDSIELRIVRFADRVPVVLDYYDADRGASARARLTADEAGLPTIRHFFKGLTALAEQGSRMGCLMCNSAIERSLVDPEAAARVKDHFDRLEDAFYTVLQNARKKGEVQGKRNLRAAARYLIVALQGMQVSLRMGQDPASVKNVVRIILHEVDSW